jgi:ribosomal protein S18 acetylase RimI-like enzyme
MTDIRFKRHSGDQTLAMLAEITAFYEEVHAEDADDESHELFSRPTFIARTVSQAQTKGFELVTATSNELLVGFSFGYPLSPGRWWGECTPPPEEVLASYKFAVIELNVRKAFRRQGIGKKLLDELLAARPEKFATLATITGSTANAMYLRWGWYKVGVFLTPPPMDALVIPLREP